MAINYRKTQHPKAPAVAAPLQAVSSSTDWSKIDSIRAEWPKVSLDPTADIQQWKQGLTLFERDDYPAMMQCATLFATALAHSLYGEGILPGNDLPKTAHKALYCSLCAPPDGRTFADSAQKTAHLAMTIIRENGWQPKLYGGNMTFFEPMMMDKGNNLSLTAAVAPADEPWAGDLKRFFAVPPSPTIGTLPDAEASRGTEMLHRTGNILEQSQAGDTASKFHMDGMTLTAQGNFEGALANYAEAAKLGSVDAMASAGDLTRKLGRTAESNFWYESAAHAGHPVGMFNFGIAALQNGDKAVAVQWLEKSAGAGNAEAFAALTQLADEAGDEVAENHWARLGAEAGHLFCMGRHGLLLARSAHGDVPTMRRARDVLEQAGERGDVDSLVLAVNINSELGDSMRSQRFASLVVQSGDAEAIDRLRRYGLL